MDELVQLHAKIVRYRELLRQADDPALREALAETIRLTQAKITALDFKP